MITHYQTQKRTFECNVYKPQPQDLKTNVLITRYHWMVTDSVMLVDNSFFELFGCLFTHECLVMGVFTNIGQVSRLKVGNQCMHLGMGWLDWWTLIDEKLWVTLPGWVFFPHTMGCSYLGRPCVLQNPWDPPMGWTSHNTYLCKALNFRV